MQKPWTLIFVGLGFSIAANAYEYDFSNMETFTSTRLECVNSAGPTNTQGRMRCQLVPTFQYNPRIWNGAEEHPVSVYPTNPEDSTLTVELRNNQSSVVAIVGAQETEFPFATVAGISAGSRGPNIEIHINPEWTLMGIAQNWGRCSVRLGDFPGLGFGLPIMPRGGFRRGDIDFSLASEEKVLIQVRKAPFLVAFENIVLCNFPHSFMRVYNAEYTARHAD